MVNRKDKGKNVVQSSQVSKLGQARIVKEGMVEGTTKGQGTADQGSSMGETDRRNAASHRRAGSELVDKRTISKSNDNSYMACARYECL